MPRSPAEFGNWFGGTTGKAGLPHCSARGLRKARATLPAESGATSFQLMSRLGWANTKQAELHTRKADRRRMAEDSARFDTSTPSRKVGTITGKHKRKQRHK